MFFSKLTPTSLFLQNVDITDKFFFLKTVTYTHPILLFKFFFLQNFSFYTYTCKNITKQLNFKNFFLKKIIKYSFFYVNNFKSLPKFLYNQPHFANFIQQVFLIKQYLACRLSRYFYFKLYKLLFGYSSYILSKLTYINNFYMFIKLSSLPQFKFHKYFDIFLRYRFVFERGATLQKNVFEVFYSAFKYKNLKYLIIWMKLIFKQVNFYKHRYLLYFFRYLFKYLENGLFEVFKIKGFYMKFHGKIAKAGNSRKQKFLIKYQSVSTSYSTNYVVEKFQINTFTGVIGVSLILNF